MLTEAAARMGADLEQAPEKTLAEAIRKSTAKDSPIAKAVLAALRF